MPRIFIISAVILSVLIWLGFKAKNSGQQTVSTALFSVAGVYLLILLGGFFGIIGE